MECVLNLVKQRMPQHGDSEGVWEGVYIYQDVEGNELGRHKSRLTHTLPDDKPMEYHQRNLFIAAAAAHRLGPVLRVDALIPEFAYSVGMIAGNVPHIYIAVEVHEVCHSAALNLREIRNLLW